MLAESKYTVATSLRVTVTHIAWDALTTIDIQKHRNRFIHSWKKFFRKEMFQRSTVGKKLLVTSVQEKSPALSGAVF